MPNPLTNINNLDITDESHINHEAVLQSSTFLNYLKAHYALVNQETDVNLVSIFRSISKISLLNDLVLQTNPFDRLYRIEILREAITGEDAPAWKNNFIVAWQAQLAILRDAEKRLSLDQVQHLSAHDFLSNMNEYSQLVRQRILQPMRAELALALQDTADASIYLNVCTSAYVKALFDAMPRPTGHESANTADHLHLLLLYALSNNEISVTESLQNFVYDKFKFVNTLNADHLQDYQYCIGGLAEHAFFAGMERNKNELELHDLFNVNMSVQQFTSIELKERAYAIIAERLQYLIDQIKEQASSNTTQLISIIRMHDPNKAYIEQKHYALSVLCAEVVRLPHAHKAEIQKIEERMREIFAVLHWVDAHAARIALNDLKIHFHKNKSMVSLIQTKLDSLEPSAVSDVKKEVKQHKPHRLFSYWPQHNKKEKKDAAQHHKKHSK